MNAETDVAILMDRVRRQRDEVLRAQQAVEALRVDGRSPCDEVVVTVCGTGELAAVRIDPDALAGADAHELGELVRVAVNDGLRRLAEASQARFAPVIAAARQAP